MSADSLVSLLVLALARTGAIHIDSNLYYIRHFSCGNVESGQLGYTLLTMEAVLHHIVSEREELAGLSAENKSLWDAVQKGEFRMEGPSDASNRSSVTLGGAEAEPIPDRSQARTSQESAASSDESSRNDGMDRPEDEQGIRKEESKGSQGSEEELKDKSKDTNDDDDPAVGEDAKDDSDATAETPPSPGNKTGVLAESSPYESYILELKKRLPEHWVSVAQSRTAHGESVLLLAIHAHDVGTLRYLLANFPTEYVSNDRNEHGKTLLVSAVETEDRAVVSCLVDWALALPTPERDAYLMTTDNWQRSVSHYFFHAPWLIQQIGDMLPWDNKDVNGQTPLFSLCRSYDHPHYHEMLDAGFSTWLRSCKRRRRPSVRDHMDKKGNTILHIIKDAKVVQRLLELDVDVNWPNERGLTPLMVYAKYSYLNSILLITKDRRCDFDRVDPRGLRSIDIAKDAATVDVLEEIFLFNRETIGGKATAVSRTLFYNNELVYVLKSGIPPRSATLSAVHRSFADFAFVHKWLAYECPFSWIPALPSLKSPFAVPSRLSRGVIRDAELCLNAYLRMLLRHPALASHELLWEFILLQDLSQQQCIDRCRRKVESRREMQYDQPVSYTPSELESVEMFFNYALEQTTMLHRALERVARTAVWLRNRVLDCHEAMDIFASSLFKVEFLQPLVANVLEPEFSATIGVLDSSWTVLTLDLLSSVHTAGAVEHAVQAPLSMIARLKDVDRRLFKNEMALSKLNNKSTWPIAVFQDRRDKEIKQTKDSIFIGQNELQRTASDIFTSHVTLASELGGYHKAQEDELAHIIKTFSRSIITSEKERLHRLRHIVDRFKDQET